MCLAALSPIAAMAKGKLSPMTLINPAYGLYKTLKKSNKNKGVIDEAGATPLRTTGTTGSSPSYGSI